MTSTPKASMFDRFLGASGAAWFLSAAGGQLMFVAYLSGLYGQGALRGDWSVWNTVMAEGYVPGDAAGNTAVSLHDLLSILITLGGLIQLTPQVRNIAPTFHRWNGRLYLALAVVITAAGLWLKYARDSITGFGDLSSTLNAVLILICAFFAVRYALARRFDHHQRWATRLFLVVSGVWFLRIMVSGWIVWHQAPLWLGPSLSGPMGTVFGYASTLVPLGVYEVYRRIRAGGQVWTKPAMAAGMLVLAALTAYGGFAASLILWLPHLR